MDNELSEKISTLTKMIDYSKYTVFFGGAGVSTESGIPDFRGTYGIYKGKYKYPAEAILSADFLESNPEYFFEFYREKLVYPNAKPNKAHLKLAELETAGKLSAVITQNIDGLHQMAGSVQVVEMHGSIHRNYCVRCGAFAELPLVYASRGVPRCGCGGMIRPAVTLYGEALDGDAITEAVNRIENADMIIIGGTSLTVYPVAGLLGYFRGRTKVIVNKTQTPLDSEADLVINAPIGETLAGIVL